MYGIFTLYDRIFQCLPFQLFCQCRNPTTPQMPKHLRFGLFPGRSPLLGESHFVFFSCRYLDVSVPCVCLPYGMVCLQHTGLPHSEICGSMVICTYPQLIAAYHVLHRLWEPRHPPYALIDLLVILSFFSIFTHLPYIPYNKHMSHCGIYLSMFPVCQRTEVI